MEILSTAQHAAHREGRIPDVEEFAHGLWAVPMALPGTFPGGASPFSFSYAVDDFAGGIHIIDPGWELEENIRRWEAFLARMGKAFADVATVTATHLHPDHLGLAGELHRRSGAPIVMHEAEADTLEGAAAALERGDAHEASRITRFHASMTRERLTEFDVPAARHAELLWTPPEASYPRAHARVGEGDLLPIPGRRVRVIWTPGHTSGHMCLAEAATEVIFTADHVLPGINSGIGLGGKSPTNPVADYLRSLERIEEFDAFVAAPGHEYRFRGLARRAQDLSSHHRRRAEEVAALMGPGRTLWQVAREVTWSDGFDNLHGYKLSSALSQIAMHMEFIAQAGGDEDAR